MKKEIADQWIAALRSGKYQQGFNVLRMNDEFCCLGVLSEISGINYHDAAIGLNSDTMEWAGMATNNGMVADADFRDFHGGCLVNTNDVLRRSFNDIADLIEKYWEKL